MPRKDIVVARRILKKTKRATIVLKKINKKFPKPKSLYFVQGGERKWKK